MNSESNKNIPSRKDVHFRNPSNKSTVNPVKINPNTQIKKNVVKTNNINHSQNSNNTEITTSLNEKEKKLTAALKAEQQKHSHLKKQIYNRKINFIKQKIKTVITASTIGLIISFAIIILFIFGYYRSITKYSQEKYYYTLSGYEFLDETNISEKNIKKFEERKSGKESPDVYISSGIKMINSTPYIPYSHISEFFNLSVAGDNSQRTIIIGSDQTDYDGFNTAVFNFNSNEISVNGSNQTLSSIPFIENDEFYIPLEFIDTFVKGIKTEKSIDKNKTNISITKTEENIYFGGSSNTPIDSPGISNYTADTEIIYNYNVDISKYSKHINPTDPDKYLMLVNINNKLPENYVPEDLVYVKTSKSRPEQQMSKDAAMALTAMLIAADAAGYDDLAVSSGYRSYSYQNSLFNQKKNSYLKTLSNEEAEIKTTETVMYPGASEHQSGLCADVHTGTTAMQTFANQKAYKWLLEHCADFGFILRYPQSKETITGVKFEPWHFRFVGRYHAQKIMSSGLSLEEYLEKLQ